jgi:hypothetical protein
LDGVQAVVEERSFCEFAWLGLAEVGKEGKFVEEERFDDGGAMELELDGVFSSIAFGRREVEEKATVDEAFGGMRELMERFVVG